MVDGLYIAHEAVGFLMLIVSIISMQLKKMEYVVILQSAANVLVVVQYGMRGELSASGICALGAIETLILFFINKKGNNVITLL